MPHHDPAYPPRMVCKPGRALDEGDALAIPGIGTIPVLAAVSFAEAPRRVRVAETLIVLAWHDLAVISPPGRSWTALEPTDPCVLAALGRHPTQERTPR